MLESFFETLKIILNKDQKMNMLNLRKKYLSTIEDGLINFKLNYFCFLFDLNLIIKKKTDFITFIN